LHAQGIDDIGPSHGCAFGSSIVEAAIATRRDNRPTTHKQLQF